MIYLIKQEIRNGSLFKIGFTNSKKRFKNYVTRFDGYATHAPTIEILETINTYKKTKHTLEKAIHTELKQKGYEFVTAFNGTRTEWIFISIEKEKEFQRLGLSQFTACNGRKINKIL